MKPVLLQTLSLSPSSTASHGFICFPPRQNDFFFLCSVCCCRLLLHRGWGWDSDWIFYSRGGVCNLPSTQRRAADRHTQWLANPFSSCKKLINCRKSALHKGVLKRAGRTVRFGFKPETATPLLRIQFQFLHNNSAIVFPE